MNGMMYLAIQDGESLVASFIMNHPLVPFANEVACGASSALPDKSGSPVFH